MSINAMNIFLSKKTPNTIWGKKSIITISDDYINIHLHKNENILTTIQKAGRKIDNLNIKNVKLTGSIWNLENAWSFWLGYRNQRKIQHMIVSDFNHEDYHEFYSRKLTIDWVRDMINAPANTLNPEQFSLNIIKFLNNIDAKNITYSTLQGQDLYEKKYHGIYTVGKGSKNIPILLKIDFNPFIEKNVPVYACLVGKGITFDTGGYSLKNNNSMSTMKCDMAGAAILVGSLALAIKRGLKKRIKLYICCAENMISGNAFKLGDIIAYRNGIKVEVLNTDAEGRLVLADGLIDASNDNPEILIDAATLTGAAKVALGNDYHACFSFDNDLMKRFLVSAINENEFFWRLPLEQFHRNLLKSNFADISNISLYSNTAGASSAAAFLSYFVTNYQRRWLHVDCSGIYQEHATDTWCIGATGLGVRTIANILMK